MDLMRAVRSLFARRAQSVSGLDLEHGYLPVSVTEETALGLSAVWACVSLIAGDLASSPLLVYEALDDGGRRRASELAQYRLLRWRPNPLMTAFRFVETLATHLLLYGNAFVEMERRAGRVAALWPVPPWLVSVQVSQGVATYTVRVPQMDPVVLTPASLLHIVGLSRDGVTGISPIRACAEVVSSAAAVQQYALRFFSQGAVPGVVLQHPGRLSDEARNNLRHSWRGMHEGLGRAHRIAILEEGMKIERIAISPQDAQMIESRRLGVSEIARIFRVPPHMIGDHERGATYASVEQQAIDYVTHTLRPWAARIEQAFTAALFEAQPQFYCEFLLDALLRGDTLSRYRAYAIGRQWGWLSANDIRRRENMDPIPGGDAYLSPLNMQQVGSDGGSDDGHTAA